MNSRAYKIALARIRKKSNKLLTDRCQIERHLSAVNDAGQPIGDWFLVATVKCRVNPVQQRGTMGEIAEREANISRYTLELPIDADLKDGDRIRYQQVIYEVQEIAFPITDAVFKSAQIVRIAE